MTSTTLNQSPVVVQTFMGALYSSQYYAADNGAVNAISIPLAIAPNAYAEGIIWFTKFAQTNTSQTVTAKVGSLAALPVVIDQAGTLPVPGSIIQNMFGMLCYSAAQNKLILLNPSESSSSYTGTLTGCTTSPTGTVNLRVSPDENTVYISIPSNLTATSNTTGCTITGGPSYLTSSSNSPVPCFIVNSGSAAVGQVQILSAGVLGLGTPNNGGGFANTGTKGIASSAFSINRAV